MEHDMKITQDVIRDLMPAYFSGEASADTRALVEEFLAGDPALKHEFERAAKEMLTPVPVTLSPDHEKKTIDRVRWLLRLRSLLVALTFFFIAIPFSFSFSQAGVHWIWGDLPRAIYGFAGLAFAIGLLWLIAERIDLPLRHPVIHAFLIAVLFFVIALPFSFRFGKGGVDWMWEKLPTGVYVGSALAYGFAVAWMLLDRRLRRLT
jgi:hypothetical protein